MQHEVDIGGRRYLVAVTRVGDGFAVTVNGRTRMVDAARIDTQTLSLLLDSVSSNDVSLSANSVSGQLDVHVGAVPFAVALNGRRRWGRKGESASPGTGPQRIAAPMPGKIVRIMVKAGDAVVARQPVVVVEAMKMENELRATRDGTVGDIHVHEGMSVDAGALLLVIQ